MPLLPGAIQRGPLPPSNFATNPVGPKIGTATHVAELTADETIAKFQTPGVQLSSHLVVAGPGDPYPDGQVFQLLDTDLIAYCQAAGNWPPTAYISMEVSGNHLSPMSPGQLESVAQIDAWASKVHGFPLVGPVAHGTPGCTVHSNPDGTPDPTWGLHSCPGAIRLAQVPGCIARAKQIVGGPSMLIDFAWARPPISLLQSLGVTAVGRYVGPASWGKTITQGEFDAYMAAGIAVWLVFEAGADDAVGGANAGTANMTQLVLPNLPNGWGNRPIYVAEDTSVDPNDPNRLGYFRGCAAVLGPARLGSYAEGGLCQVLHDEGIAQWFWQSASTSYPGNAHPLPISHIQQGVGAPVPGFDTDPNTALQADFGQCPAPGGPSPVPPSPVPSPRTIPSELFAMLASDPAFAVRFLYRFALNREVDKAGFDANIAWLNAGGDLNTVLANLQDSPEGQTVINAERKLLGI
jgi:hypothetical protein